MLPDVLESKEKIQSKMNTWKRVFAHGLSVLDFISRQSVCTAKVKVGAPEKQRAHHRLLHKADPGGAEIPARQPDSTPRYQGDYGEVTVQFCLFNLLFVLHFFWLFVVSLERGITEKKN